MKYLIISIFLILIGCATQHKIRENKIRENEVDKYIRIAEQYIKDGQFSLALGRIRAARNATTDPEKINEINVLFDKLKIEEEKQAKLEEEKKKSEEKKADEFIRSAEQSIKDGNFDIAYDQLYRAEGLTYNLERQRKINTLINEIMKIRRKKIPGTLEYRQEYVKNHRNLSKRIRNCILEEKICLKMTKEQVEASWGKPRDINRTVGSWGVHEQWIYGEIPHSNYLYFENGKLTSWQD